MVDIMTDYRLWRATATGELIETIDDFQSFEFTSVYNDVGGWVLNTGSDVGSRLQKGEQIYLRREPSGDVPARVVTGGPWVERTSTFDRDGRTFTIAGADENVLLTRRVMWPVPLDDTPPWASSHFIVPAGRISTVLIAAVKSHLGVDALPARQHPGLSVAADPAVGSQASMYARFESLLTSMRLACELADWWAPWWDGTSTVIVIVPGVLEIPIGPPVRFQIQQNVFKVEACRDLSAEIVWSVGRGNVESASVLERAPEANAVIVGGQGDLTARQFVLGDDAETVNTWGRIERFADRRDIDTLSQDYVRQELAQTPEISAVEMIVSDAADTWLSGWDLGDTVTITADGLTTVGQVAKVAGALTVDGGFRVVPTVGKVGALSQLPAVNRQTNNLDRRLSLRERQ